MAECRICNWHRNIPEENLTVEICCAHKECVQELKDRLIGVTEEGKSLREGIQVKLAKIQRLEEKLEVLKSKKIRNKDIESLQRPVQEVVNPTGVLGQGNQLEVVQSIENVFRKQRDLCTVMEKSSRTCEEEWPDVLRKYVNAEGLIEGFLTEAKQDVEKLGSFVREMQGIMKSPEGEEQPSQSGRQVNVIDKKIDIYTHRARAEAMKKFINVIETLDRQPCFVKMSVDE